MRKFFSLFAVVLLLVVWNCSCKRKNGETSPAGSQGSKQEAGDDRTAADLRVESAERLAKLVRALLIYSNDHEDKFPDSLDGFSSPPLSPEEMQWVRDTVEYLGRDVTVNNDPGTVLVYDKVLLQKGIGTNVAFLDTHVAFVKPDELASLGIPPEK